jgi:hypothetical protein
MDPLLASIELAVQAHFPGRSINQLRDRTWYRRIIEVHLNDGEHVFIKFDADPQNPSSTLKESEVVRLFHAHGLPAPDILAVDTSCKLLPLPYLIQRAYNGAKLVDLIDLANEDELPAIYAAIGQFYHRLHAIHASRSGWFVESADKPYEISPNDYMFQAEMAGGGGKEALEEGRIPEAIYQRALRVWTEHLDMEPQNERNRLWRQTCLEDVEQFLDEIVNDKP